MNILCFSILGPKISLTLDPGSYIFSVSALTSGGAGDEATLTMDIKDNSMAKDI